MSIDKYIGRCVEKIYLNRQQQVSQRTIRIISVKMNKKVTVFDEKKDSPRLFGIEGILSIKPVMSNVS